MKILIANDSPNAHYFERLGLAKAFGYSGFRVMFWNIHNQPAFDVFNDFEPDIFVGQAYNLNRALIKCIQARPHLRVVLKAGDFGPFYDDWDEAKHTTYPILMANEQEKNNVGQLIDSGSVDGLFIHYHPDYIDSTHGYWKDAGTKIFSSMNAADIFDYTNGRYHEELASDLVFVGGRWGYKARTLDKYLLPLCNVASPFSIKIFGNTNWGVPQYCGAIETEHVKHLFSSALICPSISEPHSQEFGFDIIERPFKLMSNRAFVISDYVEGLHKLYNEYELVIAKTPRQFFELIQHFIDNPDLRHDFIVNGYKKTIAEHTYFDRAINILNFLGLDITQIVEGKKRAIEELKL